MYMLEPMLAKRMVLYTGMMYLPRLCSQFAVSNVLVLQHLRSFACARIVRSAISRHRKPPPPPQGTHLLPESKAIVLLHLPLVLGNIVLAEDPAAGCQSRTT